VRHHALGASGGRVFCIKVLRIDVAREDREQLDVVLREGAFETGAITDGQFVESTIAHALQAVRFG
jgi:hypothetical protein